MYQDLRFHDISRDIIGAAIEVHKNLKSGYTENIYHRALEYELELREILYEPEKEIKIIYKGRIIGNYKIDLLINKRIVVELKAVQEFCNAHISQVISYLKATQLNVGLLLNFSKSKLEIRRVVWDEE
jgi:GxxExxY protein